jgi:hypothetical protein
LPRCASASLFLSRVVSALFFLLRVVSAIFFLPRVGLIHLELKMGFSLPPTAGYATALLDMH